MTSQLVLGYRSLRRTPLLALTIIATLFMPLTVLTGMYGMNVPLPLLPGGEHAQFWWVCGIMFALSAGMLAFFRRKGWI